MRKTGRRYSVNNLISFKPVLSILSLGSLAFFPSALLGEPAALSQPQALQGEARSRAQVLDNFRASLNNRGIDLTSVMTEDASRSIAGDNKDGDGFMRYTLDLSLNIDGAPLMGWNGGKAHVQFKQHKILAGQTSVDVAQGYSNIDSQSFSGLYEMWGQQTLFGDALRVKGGKIDANTEFAFLATASDFLNGSMGYSPTIMELPTYPNPQLGILAAVTPMKATQATLGVFRVAGGGNIDLAEVAQTWHLQHGALAGRISAGSWLLNKEMSHFDNSPDSGTHGIYGTAEQTLWRRPAADVSGEDRSLSAFVQYGTGRSSDNPYLYHLGGGTVLNSPFHSRPSDAVGLAVSRLHFSNDPRCGYDAKAETVIESYYRFKVIQHMSLVTDAQSFQNPDGHRSHSNYVVVTPRIVMTF
jgi:carbohydrate-selective porin OprB